MKSAWYTKFKKSSAPDRTSSDGKTFHSKLEMNRYEELKYLQSMGEISELQCQVRFDLIPWGHKTLGSTMILEPSPIRTPSGRTAQYIADFVYKDRNGQRIIQDVKGMRADKYSLFKIAVFEAIYGEKVSIYGVKERKKKISGARKKSLTL